MYIPPSATITASGAQLRGVICENCGCQYLYKMSRQINHTVTVQKFNTNPSERQRKSIEKRLNRAMKKGIDPVHCPDCGYLQRTMVSTIKYEQLAFLILIAFPALFITVVLGVISAPDIHLCSPWLSWIFASLTFTALFIAACAIPLRKLNTPHRMQRRIESSNHRALRRQDFPDLATELFQTPSTPN